MRQRYLLSLLCAIAMLYYALPQLPFFSGNEAAQLFAVTWFLFALVVIGGNLSAILFQKERKQATVHKEVTMKNKGRLRSYH
ncbi:hypothetical protein CIB95_06325 [Lottiidibacillus patelloidae]|uniref:Uncharacterized protein n=1 Tax=Lottiidibacillus patelloidae TaxID=2670334 RepID=A0A263BWL2_9BACI|nr:hypothetical protein [Lottiidibacillus patelloidae]OZM57968.1 hypothetical protein CIB95_06325 [Lottiidibacillus patelloidae]